MCVQMCTPICACASAKINEFQRSTCPHPRTLVTEALWVVFPRVLVIWIVPSCILMTELSPRILPCSQYFLQHWFWGMENKCVLTLAEIASHPWVPNPSLMALSPQSPSDLSDRLGVLCHLLDVHASRLPSLGFDCLCIFKKLRYKSYAIKPLLLDTQFSDVPLLHRVSQPLPKWATFASTPRETPSTNVPALCPQSRQPPIPFLLLLVCFVNTQCFITQMRPNHLGPLGLGFSELGQWLQASFSVKLLWVFCMFCDWLLLCLYEHSLGAVCIWGSYRWCCLGCLSMDVCTDMFSRYSWVCV